VAITSIHSPKKQASCIFCGEPVSGPDPWHESCSELELIACERDTWSPITLTTPGQSGKPEER
jgi:hypothetical protein